jgi:hypothetical protein
MNRLLCHFSFLIFWIIHFFSQFSHAQVSQSRFENSPQKSSTAGSNVKVEATGYFSESEDSSNPQQAFKTIGQLKFNKDSLLNPNLDLTAAYSNKSERTHFGVTEMSLSIKSGASEYTLGRKLFYWSLQDHRWQLGMWQPNFSQIDSLRPIDQGLAGLFYNLNNSQHDLLLFFSPIFIPSMGPDVQEKDGSLVSDSRWYKQPSASFPFQGKDVRILYNLDLTEVPDLIKNPGWGARYKLGDEKNYWISANLSRKPINSLLLRYNAFLRTTESETRGEVTVSPAVGYQTLRGIDTGYHFGFGNVEASYLDDQPDFNTVKEGWIQQQPEPFNSYMLGLNSDFFSITDKVDAQVGLSYLRVSGGKITDYDSQGVPQGSIFENRFIFTNALQLKSQLEFYFLKKKMLSTLRYVREVDQEGELFSGNLDWFPSRQLYLSVGIDVLSVDDLANSDSTFLNQFRANDRLIGGLGYVF